MRPSPHPKLSKALALLNQSPSLTEALASHENKIRPLSHNPQKNSTYVRPSPHPKLSKALALLNQGPNLTEALASKKALKVLERLYSQPRLGDVGGHQPGNSSFFCSSVLQKLLSSIRSSVLQIFGSSLFTLLT